MSVPSEIEVVTVGRLTDADPSFWDPAAGAVVLRAVHADTSVDSLRRLGNAFGSTRPPWVGLHDEPMSEVLDIRPSRHPRRDWRGVALRSHSYDEEPLRTDGFNAEFPPSTVLYQMVNSSPGGMTVLLPAWELASRLDELVLTSLSEPVFPTLNGPCQLLWQTDGVWQVRLNIYELNENLRKGRSGGLMQDHHLTALSVLGAFFDTFGATRRIDLVAGDVLVINNRTTLHGRYALDKRIDAERHTRRMWIK